MLSQRIDTDRLTNDIRTLISDCIHLKKVLRSTWTRPMAEEQRRHARVRRDLTERLVLLAATRGKVHVRTPPRELTGVAREGFVPEEHARTIAARLLPDYAAATMLGGQP